MLRKKHKLRHNTIVPGTRAPNAVWVSDMSNGSVNNLRSPNTKSNTIPSTTFVAGKCNFEVRSPNTWKFHEKVPYVLQTVCLD